MHAPIEMTSAFSYMTTLLKSQMDHLDDLEHHGHGPAIVLATSHVNGVLHSPSSQYIDPQWQPHG